MKKRIFFGVIFFLIAAGAVFPQESSAFYLMGDKLRVKGSVYEFMIYGTDIDKDTGRYYRNTNFGLLRTKGTLELLYKAYECQDNLINLFGFFQWYHESVPDFDGNYRRSITPGARKRFQEPRWDQDDWINELYVDYYKGPWNIRLGKQIIFWSEVELVRTIDQVNQLDLRYSTPGIDPWDEIKLGLWMMRGFYNSQLPGQLIFEWIWIPGDFEPVRIPTEGTYWASNPGPQGPENMRPRPYSANAANEDMWRKSRPALSLKNSSYALRVRGNSEVTMFKTPYLLDWTVSWLHTMNNTPVTKQEYLGSPSSLNFSTSNINGYYNNLAVSRVFGAKYLPSPPNAAWWEYKFYNLLAASVQTYVPKIKGVLRGEFMYELRLPELTADPGGTTPSYSKPITGTTKRDVVNFGVTYDVPIRWNWLQNQQWLGANGVLDTSFGYNGQWRLGEIQSIRRTFGYQQKSQTNFTVTVRTSLRNNEFTPVYRMLWNTKKWGYAVVALRYTPGAHFRYEAGYMFFQAHNIWDAREAQAKHKDGVYFRAGYEF